MNQEKIRNAINQGKTFLGMELGSTRIKAVLIGEDHMPVASGGHEWENQYVDGIWTYSLSDVWEGIQDCYRKLAEDVRNRYQTDIRRVSAIGISAMMHGYLAFDQKGEQLAQFRTWRNTCTEQAAKELTTLFQYNIPLRWSIAHLYQAVLNQEEHVKQVEFITTLSGYVHWKLTGKKVLGIGDAAGMFPIDTEKKDYYDRMLEKFNELVATHGYSWNVKSMLPKVLTAGEDAGVLTEEGARMLDPTGMLEAGIPMCAPEGDAGTGMVATNSVGVRTGNVSAGTSIFAMLVLEKELQKLHEEIDMVTTPAGDLVAMVHCNNCTSDINDWVRLFQEFGEAMGMTLDKGELFTMLYKKALEGDPDCGGMMSYCYLSGEPITGLDEGRPLFVRMPDSRFSLANFMRTHILSPLGGLRLGMDILTQEEQVTVDKVLGHGGFFKTPEVGQRMMAAAMEAPVTVMETAGEGGAWGIALLASYLVERNVEETLEEYLKERVFSDAKSVTLEPDAEDVRGFRDFMVRYKKGIAIEKAAADYMK